MSKIKGQKVSCCGKKLKPGAKECPRCHRVTKAGFNANLRKAVAAQPGARFLAKAAGGGQVAYCANGHPNRPGGRFCAHCPELMPGQMVPPLAAVKSDPGAYQYWLRQGQSTHKSDERELINKMLYGGA